MNFLDERIPNTIWDKLTPCPMSGCWLWTWDDDPKRHFRVRINGRDSRAHIEMAKVAGVLVESGGGHRIIPACGNDLCCNPAHLVRGLRSKVVERDLEGQTFGHLLVLRRAPLRPRRTGSYRRYWECVCQCGRPRTVRESSLVHGSVKSCGCGNRRPTSRPNLVVDRRGQRFGKLTVLDREPIASSNGMRWYVRCDCGEEKTILSSNLPDAKACRACVVKHGYARRGKKTGEYKIWVGMVRRCTSESDAAYPLYGGRGISVCDQWQGDGGFERFLADVGPRPSGMKNNRALYSLDRIDPNGDYEPGNVRWATAHEQMQNTRTARARVAAVLEAFKDRDPDLVDEMRRALLGV